MERIESKTVYEGWISTVRIDKFRHDDGSTSEREVVVHPGGVAIVAHDGERVWLVRQPREVVGEPALLELPAGKLDVDGESPLDCAKRELAEEVGKRARDWLELKAVWMTPGWADEKITVYLATGLEDVDRERAPDERIEVVGWPLAELDGAIDECRDAKTAVGLLMLRDMRSRSP